MATNPRHSKKQQIPRPSHNRIGKKHAAQNPDRIDNKNKKWVTFTYHSHKVRKITNPFKQTDIKIAFRSMNTIQQQSRPKNREMTPDHNESGIYNYYAKPATKRT
jgi:hypothetical protein